MKKEKLNVLFIAKNIPSPQKKSNRIIFDIAHKLSAFCEIEFLFPREIVPFWLKGSKKFAHLNKLKSWNFDGFRITPIKYVQLPFKKSRFWLLIYLPQKVKKYILKKKNLDLIHAHYLMPDGYLAYKILKKFGIPYIVTFRNQDRRNLQILSKWNPDYIKAKKVLINARKVIVPNSGYKEYIKDNFDVNCQIVPHGIEKEVFQSTVENKKEKLSILSVADSLPTKNIDWVVKAFKEYTGNKEIQLRLVGDVCNREDIKALAKENNQIQLLGKIPREKVLTLMRESDIFALPSSKETFGLVYLEAAATHNAIIGFKGEGVWGVFKESEEMLFCSGYSEFEQQLHEVINNKTVQTMLSENAYTKAKAMEWSKIAHIYQEIYKSFISSE